MDPTPLSDVRRCAFLTMDDLAGFVSYDHLACAPLALLGWSVADVSWRTRDVDWSGFDAVVIRTTWDYQLAPDAFLDVLAHIDSATLLENALATVRWNLRKTYLADLHARGVPIVPTLFGDSPSAATLSDAFRQFDCDRLVIKPQVGANAGDALPLDEHARDTGRNMLDDAAALFRGRGYLLQPFMPGITTEGEYALIFFNGEYSHAILKTPARGDFRVQEEHGGIISAVTPEPLLLRRAHDAIAAVGTVPLYARADLVRTAGDDFAVMELELIEPSLYLSHDAAAPARFARAIDMRCG